MINEIFKKLHIKAKPEKVLTYIFYALSIAVALFCLTKILSITAGSIRISDWVSTDSLLPYGVSILFLLPVLAFSFFVNSGIPKSDNEKINILRNYKPYLANIIYSDLFEHLSLVNDKEIVEIKNMIKYIILNRNNFKTEVLLRKEILKLYVSLNMDNYKRKEARKKFSEEDFSLIRRINPLYKLDS